MRKNASKILALTLALIMIFGAAPLAGIELFANAAAGDYINKLTAKTPAEIDAAIEADESFIVIWCAEDCTNCTTMGKGVITRLIDVYEKDVWGFVAETADGLSGNVSEPVLTKLGASGSVQTPIIAFIKNGEVENAYQGYKDAAIIYEAAGIVPLTNISLNANKKVLAVNGTVQLVPAFAPTNATLQDVEYKSSNETVATVSETGLVTALKLGVATITATAKDNNLTATYAITVGTPVTGVTIDDIAPEDLPVYTDKSLALKAIVAPEDATVTGVTFKSSDEKIATVNAAGVVTALKEGNVTITVTTEDGGFTDTVDLECKVRVTGVELNITSKTLAQNGTLTLVAKVLPENASDKTYSFESSNSKVATVTADGVVTCVAAKGIANIIVTTNDNKKIATCAITAGVPVESVALSVAGKTLAPGDTFQLVTTVDPVDANEKNVTYKSDDEAIATVSPSGLVTAVASGRAVITATAKDGGKTATCDILVGTVESITVLTKPTKINGYYVDDDFKKDGLEIAVTYKGESGNMIETVGADDVTCSPATIQTDKDGKQEITVTYGGAKTEFTVGVIPTEVTALKIKNEAAKTEYIVGEELNTYGLALTATIKKAKPEDITIFPSNADVEITCEELTTVGEKTVTITYKGQTATYTVKVVPVALKELRVINGPTTIAYAPGDTFNSEGMTFLAVYSDGTTKELTAQEVTFSPTTFTTTGGQYVTATYSGVSTSINVNVTEPTAVERILRVFVNAMNRFVSFIWGLFVKVA